MRTSYRQYYILTKPGIIYGNLFMLAGGYLYGARGVINFLSLVGAIAGTAFIIACGCVINNYIDRDIDTLMHRTSKRALVTGQISGRAALIYASFLGVIGFTILLLCTNQLTTLLGAIGLSSYAFIYTFSKRHTVHSTLIGTLPGALPPVAGYTAATNRLDSSALILFLIMVCWQMVHFYAIAIFRQKDYKRAGIPTMVNVHGARFTIAQMYVYVIGFVATVVGLWLYSYAGLLFMAIMLPLSLWWVYVVWQGLRAKDYTAWARQAFTWSLLLLPSLGAVLALSGWLHPA